MVGCHQQQLPEDPAYSHPALAHQAVGAVGWDELTAAAIAAWQSREEAVGHSGVQGGAAGVLLWVLPWPDRDSDILVTDISSVG